MISSVSSVKSLERYIFSSWRSSSLAYSRYSPDCLTMKWAVRSASGLSISKNLFKSSSACVLARVAAARSTGNAFSRSGSSSSACLSASSLIVFSTAVSSISLSILSRSNSTRMSPFLTGLPSSMACSTCSGMAQAFGLIETSVIRLASKMPLKTTSILNGPFSTLAVAGLLLPGDAVGKSVVDCSQLDFHGRVLRCLPSEGQRLESADRRERKRPESTPLPVRMPNFSPMGPRSGSISSVVSPLGKREYIYCCACSDYPGLVPEAFTIARAWRARK